MREVYNIARAALAVLLFSFVPASSNAQIAGAIRGYAHLPIFIYDNTNREVGKLNAKTAPPPSGILVYGWQPSFKRLLVRLRPDDPDVVYIGFGDVVMVDQAQWDARMRADSALVCAPPPNIIVVSKPGEDEGNTTKAFKNPCR